MAEPKRKCRQYNAEYLKFGFVPSPNNTQLPLCLLCEKVLTNEAMKPSRLSNHLTKIHPDKVTESLPYFTALRDKFHNRKSIHTMLTTTTTRKIDDGLICSYNIAKLIAQSGKPHSIGEELILPAIEEVLRTVMHHPSPNQIIKRIPLSNDTVQRRIDEMAISIEDTLCDILKSQQFSLQLDESTLPGNESLLLGYVRFIKDSEVVQELLFAEELETDTKGESVFLIVEKYFKNKEIPLRNIIACATDGAPALTGRYRGFLAFLKKAVPNVLTIHCVIHRQQLVAKNLSERLHKSLSIVITTVNKIKTLPLNSRLFRQLCIKNDEEFERLLLHTEVRWLSKGNCLKRFYSLFKSVIEFLRESKSSHLSEELEACKCDIAYMTDLFSKFNEMNLQLQGNDINLIKAKSVICSFMTKLSVFRQNVGRRELGQFPNLAQLENDGNPILDDDILIFCNHLKLLHEDMTRRYQDLLDMQIPDWLINPFSEIPLNEIESTIQMEFIDLKNDLELKPLFKQSYQEFWLQKEVSERYPGLWEAVKIYFIAFPTSYMAERGFSAVARLLTKQRNRLQVVKRDLRLLLSNIDPNIANLASKHQSHSSH